MMGPHHLLALGLPHLACLGQQRAPGQGPGAVILRCPATTGSHVRRRWAALSSMLLVSMWPQNLAPDKARNWCASSVTVHHAAVVSVRGQPALVSNQCAYVTVVFCACQLAGSRAAGQSMCHHHGAVRRHRGPEGTGNQFQQCAQGTDGGRPGPAAGAAAGAVC